MNTFVQVFGVKFRLYIARCIFAVIACGFIQVSVHAEEPHAFAAWINTANKILHQVAGDDLKAYWSIAPKIEVIDDERANAFAYAPDRIIVSNGLLKLINTESELAFILLHEIAHLKELNQPIKLGQTKLGGFKGRYLNHELTADQFSSCQMQGYYDRRAGPAIIEKILKNGSKLANNFNTIYPSLSVRKAALLKLITKSKDPETSC